MSPENKQFLVVLLTRNWLGYTYSTPNYGWLQRHGYIRISRTSRNFFSSQNRNRYELTLKGVQYASKHMTAVFEAVSQRKQHWNRRGNRKPPKRLIKTDAYGKKILN